MSYILYGSQTGQAKSIAENLYDNISKKIKILKICELDEIDKSYFFDKVNIAIIICSTTGDGDAPENAARFIRKIKSYSISSLSHLRYTVLGLGDTNYSNFCNCGRIIDSVLNTKGAQRFFRSSWADDAIGLEIVVEPWLEGLYNVLSGVYKDDLETMIEKISICDISAETVAPDSVTVLELLGEVEAFGSMDSNLCVPLSPEPFLHIEYSSDCNIQFDKPIISTIALPANNSGLVLARVADISKMTDKYAIKTVHKVKVDSGEDNWSWSPGDSIGVCPCNPQNEVDAILTRLQVPLESRHCGISLSLIPRNKKKNSKVPEHLLVSPNVNLSLQNVLGWLCDIRAPLSKVGLKIMADYCPIGSAEQRRLLQLCSKEGNMLHLKCIREPCMPILDLLNWFPSCSIPIARLLEVLPRLKPRAYSLCDCSSIVFAFSKVDIAPVQAFRKRPLTGICTTYMENMARPDAQVMIPIYLRKNLSGFTVTNPEDPHILIGPGTGVAPFISFLQYFEKLKAAGERVGPVWLFFGCRNKDRDFIFREELEYFQEKEVLSHLCVCFSRDVSQQSSMARGRVCAPEKCKYVQDCLMHHARDLTSLVVDGGARIFVCGDATGLAKDVLAAWSDVLLGNHETVASKKDADGHIARMRISRRYLEDVWC